MIRQFVEQCTFPSPGSTIGIAALRRRYEAQHGKVNRTTFVAALAAAGVQIAYDEVQGNAVVVGRTITPPVQVEERNGCLVLTR